MQHTLTWQIICCGMWSETFGNKIRNILQLFVSELCVLHYSWSTTDSVTLSHQLERTTMS